MTLGELKKILEDCGVVGAGGGGFPTHLKIDSRVKTVILNCAECEPLVKVDQFLLAKYPQQIISALKILSDVLNCDIKIAVKKSYSAAISAVEKIIINEPLMELALLNEVYPAGDEILLIHEVLDLVIPPGSFPIESGCAVLNVETVYNISGAIEHGAAVTHKWVTIAGEVKNTRTIRVPVGIPVGEAVEAAGGSTVDYPTYIVGGVMMGDLTTEVITKTTNAIIVLPQDHYLVHRAKFNPSIELNRVASACCQCRNCTDMCPRFLLGYPIEPHKIMRAVAARDATSETFNSAMYCSLCGVCEMVACPQSLAPRSLIKIFRSALVKAGMKPIKCKARPISEGNAYRKVAAKRLVARLGLSKYDA